MSFIVQPVSSSSSPQNFPVTVEAVTAAPYYPGTSYTWNITNFDSYVTYTVTTSNGSVSLAGVQIIYTPATVGIGGFFINGRDVSLTISAIPRWISTLTSASADVGTGIKVDGSGNVYIVGYSDVSGNQNFEIAKYSFNGTIQWQRRLGSNTQDDFGYSIAVDSSGEIFIAGRTNDPSTGYFQLARYNSAGTIQWQRYLQAFAGAYGIALDSSNNVYVGGVGVVVQTAMQFAKYNSSGTIQWQRTLSDTTNMRCEAIAVDSSANLYGVGSISPGTIRSAQIVKYNTFGTIQWQRELGNALTIDHAFGVAVDSSGNLYLAGLTNVSGTNDALVAKYNTSGAIQWQRRLGGFGSTFGFGCAVDASSNVYIIGRADYTGNENILIAKYNASGTIQWQRILGTSGNENGASIAVDNGGNIYIVGSSNASGTNDIVLAKLPADGSLTGTYIVGGFTYTYSASTLTDAATTLTDAAGIAVDAASSFTAATSTLIDAATTLTSTTTAI